MKKTMIFFSILFVMMFTLSFSWTFLETPTSFVLSDGAFQYSNVNLFSQNSWIVGMGGFSQIGIVNSSFLEQFQFLKDPFDLSAGMKIGFGGTNSAFMALGKKFKSFDISTAISYVSPSSSESYFIFHVMANAPLSFGDVRLEYKNGAYSNELATGIAARFSASKEIEWLFKTISIGIGVGWDFNNDNNFFPSKTYFVFQYMR